MYTEFSFVFIIVLVLLGPISTIASSKRILSLLFYSLAFPFRFVRIRRIFIFWFHFVFGFGAFDPNCGK